MAGGAVLAAVVFVIVEMRSREPLVPLTMFRNRTYTLAVIASIATGISMFGTSVFLGQYMQMARGATPTEAGLLTLPMIAGRSSRRSSSGSSSAASVTGSRT